MTKIIWMSDLHFISTGTIGGLDPRERLRLALDHANATYPDAAFIVVSGDLLDDDADPAYAQIADVFARSALPIYPMMGNNDQREDFRKHLTLPDQTDSDFIQFAIDTPEASLLCLDTHKDGSAAGAYCERRHAWLETQLASSGDKPIYIFMHHPPVELGLPAQDRIGLDDPLAFLDLITSHSNVAGIFAGHVHRTVTAIARGIPITTLGAISFQAPAPRPDWNWDTFIAAQEAPRYGVIDLAPDGMTLQFIKFCDYDAGMAQS